MKALVSFLLTLFLFSVLASYSQDPELDPRLKNIIDAIESAQKTAGSEATTRTNKYLEDLKVLEKKLAATGDLDKVLQVTNERKAWESGEPTPSIDPKDNSFVLDLRKLRYYFDQDLIKAQGVDTQNDNQTKTQIVAKLDELEKALTTESKIPQALEVRKIKENFVAGTFKAPPPVESEKMQSEDDQFLHLLVSNNWWDYEAKYTFDTSAPSRLICGVK